MRRVDRWERRSSWSREASLIAGGAPACCRGMMLRKDWGEGSRRAPRGWCGAGAIRSAIESCFQLESSRATAHEVLRSISFIVGPGGKWPWWAGMVVARAPVARDRRGRGAGRWAMSLPRAHRLSVTRAGPSAGESCWRRLPELRAWWSWSSAWELERAWKPSRCEGYARVPRRNRVCSGRWPGCEPREGHYRRSYFCGNDYGLPISTLSGGQRTRAALSYCSSGARCALSTAFCTDLPYQWLEARHGPGRR